MNVTKAIFGLRLEAFASFYESNSDKKVKIILPIVFPECHPRVGNGFTGSGAAQLVNMSVS